MSLRLLAFSLVALGAAWAQPIAPSTPTAPASVRGVWQALDATHNTCANEFDYHPDGGLRIFGCHLWSKISLKGISALAGQAIFASGPHTLERLDLNNAKVFGRYNPAFVRWAVDHLIPAATDPAFKTKTQPLYNKYVKPLATAFYVTYRKIQAEPACFKQEVARYERFLRGQPEIDMPHERYFFFMNPRFCSKPDGSFNFFYKNGFDGGYRGNVIKSCFAWWVRRTLDGTAPEFWRGLERLVSTYDPALLAFQPAAPIGDLKAPQNPKDAWLTLGAPGDCQAPSEYHPHGGLGIFECLAVERIGLARLAAWAGAPIFKSGPHSPTQLNRYAKTFGHYNPAFVRWAVDHLIPAAADPAFKAQTQALYDAHLKPMARAAFQVYRKIQLEPSCFQSEVARYKRFLGGERLDDMPYYRYYYFMNPAFCKNPDGGYGFFSQRGETAGSPGAMVQSCFAWWVRRTLDGTAPEFWRGLVKLIKVYDPALMR